MKVSFITPVYKCEKTITESVMNQLAVLEDYASNKLIDYELIAVVDGFLDDSLNILKKIAENHPRLKVFGYKYNRGKGFAVRLGSLQATGDYIGFIDAGTDINPVVMTHLIDSLSKNPDCHIAVGSKQHKQSQLTYPLKRKLFTRGFKLINKILFNLNYNDTQVGAKLFSRELVESVFTRILVKRFAFDVEILVVSDILGYKKHMDVPVVINFEANETSINYKLIVNMAIDSLAIWYRKNLVRFYNDKNQKNWSGNMHDLLINRPAA